jgi:hypothetical protein
MRIALNGKTNQSRIVLLSIFLGWSWLTSELTFACLGLSNRTYPWSLWIVMSHGIYLEPLVCGIGLAFSLGLVLLWVQGGVAGYSCEREH